MKNGLTALQKSKGGSTAVHVSIGSDYLSEVEKPTLKKIQWMISSPTVANHVMALP